MSKWDRLFAAKPGKFYKFIVPDAPRDIVIEMKRTKPRMESGSSAHVSLQQAIQYHSYGFEWGYGGSGPADLALNILMLFVLPPEAWRLHHDYKNSVIARVPEMGGTIRGEDVVKWLNMKWNQEGAGK